MSSLSRLLSRSSEKLSAQTTATTVIELREDVGFSGERYKQIDEFTGNETENSPRLIPMPTADPRDPLNLPTWRKMAALGSLCLFGAMAAAAELVLGAMLPVFSFQYAGIDPKLLTKVHLPEGINALTILAEFPGPPIWKIYLLASLPILMMGATNFILIPLAIATGRRNVLLVTGVIALAGCVGSGFSTSLATHLVCRVIQAVGAGTIESLIPFILQDIIFYHQRNAAVSVVFATQGLIIVALGVASPYIIGHANWRVIYFATAAAGLLFWVCLFFFLPETKFDRSENEKNGIPAVPLRPGQKRPDIDHVSYPPRRFKDGIKLFQCKVDWRSGIDALLACFRTFFYPHMLFVTLLNSAVIAMALAAGYTTAPQLLAAPWSWNFYHLGFCLFPLVVAAGASFLISGWGADQVANWLARRNGKRNPEFQALNLIIPCLAGLIGCIVFAISGDNPAKYHWMLFLLGLGMIAFAFLATNTIGIVYVLESYPHLTGPALVNIASFRLIVAFVLSFRVSEWVAELGYLKTFIIPPTRVLYGKARLLQLSPGTPFSIYNTSTITFAMSAPDNAEYELLTEHFSYPPVSLLDDIINAVNVLADRALGAVETALTKLPAQSLGFGGGPSKKRGAPGADPAAPDTATTTPNPDDAAKREIEHGTHQLETLLNASIDKNFDIFELYVMRNILTVKPDDQPYMQLAHYQGLDFDAPAAGADAHPTLDSVTQLRRRLHASQKLQVALETERVRNDALLRTLRAAVGVGKPAASASVKKEDGEAGGDAEQQQQQQQTDTLGFLHDRGTLEEGGTERPITTTTEFILAQLQTLRSLSTSLRSLIPDIDDGGDDDNDDAEDGKDGKSWRRERAEYIETASRRYLETVAGVELGPAGEMRDGEWQGPGRGLARDEVEGLEAVVAALGAQQQQQQQQQPATGEAPAPAQEQVEGSDAEQDEDEDMAES